MLTVLVIAVVAVVPTASGADGSEGKVEAKSARVGTQGAGSYPQGADTAVITMSFRYDPTTPLQYTLEHTTSPSWLNCGEPVGYASPLTAGSSADAANTLALAYYETDFHIDCHGWIYAGDPVERADVSCDGMKVAATVTGSGTHSLEGTCKGEFYDPSIRWFREGETWAACYTSTSLLGPTNGCADATTSPRMYDMSIRCSSQTRNSFQWTAKCQSDLKYVVVDESDLPDLQIRYLLVDSL